MTRRRAASSTTTLASTLFVASNVWALFLKDATCDEPVDCSSKVDALAGVVRFAARNTREAPAWRRAQDVVWAGDAYAAGACEGERRECADLLTATRQTRRRQPTFSVNSMLDQVYLV